MSNKTNADIKLAYQAAAEIAFLVAVGLSQTKQKQKRSKCISISKNIRHESAA